MSSSPFDTVKVLTWNLRHQGQRARIARLARRIAQHAPDVALLQEVDVDAREDLRSALRDAGFPVFLGAEHRFVEGTTKRYGSALASRVPLEAIEWAWSAALPFPELCAAGVWRTQLGPVELLSVHIPNGSGNGVKKVEAMQAIADTLASAPTGLRILGGDLNTPKSESASGELEYWDQRAGRGAAWREKERALLEGRDRHGLRDAFREEHPCNEEAWSHKAGGRRRRYDHLLVSARLDVVCIEYDHEALRDSDHAPLCATLRLRTPSVAAPATPTS